MSLLLIQLHHSNAQNRLVWKDFTFGKNITSYIKTNKQEQPRWGKSNAKVLWHYFSINNKNIKSKIISLIFLGSNRILHFITFKCEKRTDFLNLFKKNLTAWNSHPQTKTVWNPKELNFSVIWKKCTSVLNNSAVLLLNAWRSRKTVNTHHYLLKIFSPSAAGH